MSHVKAKQNDNVVCEANACKFADLKKLWQVHVSTKYSFLGLTLVLTAWEFKKPFL
jgi:hypothetical protein